MVWVRIISWPLRFIVFCCKISMKGKGEGSQNWIFFIFPQNKSQKNGNNVAYSVLFIRFNRLLCYMVWVRIISWPLRLLIVFFSNVIWMNRGWGKIKGIWVSKMDIFSFFNTHILEKYFWNRKKYRKFHIFSPFCSLYRRLRWRVRSISWPLRLMIVFSSVMIRMNSGQEKGEESKKCIFSFFNRKNRQKRAIMSHIPCIEKRPSEMRRAAIVFNALPEE